MLLLLLKRHFVLIFFLYLLKRVKIETHQLKQNLEKEGLHYYLQFHSLISVDTTMYPKEVLIKLLQDLDLDFLALSYVVL